MSYEDDLIRRLRQEDAGVRSEAARRGHLLKMAFAGGISILCLGLFACGVLSGDRGKGKVEQMKTASTRGRKLDAREAGWQLLSASGPEIAAILVGGASGVCFLFLLMRLRKFD